MIPEIGQIALIIAFVIAILQSILPLLALHQNNQQWQAIVKPCAYGLTFFVTLAYAVLTYSFISNDFTVRYVALNSNTALPLFYRVSALWGGHEGSMLLWLFIYTIWMVLFTYRSRDLPRQMVNTILAIMAIIATGLLAFILFTSNPFLRFLPQYPTQGIDLNPVLQDPGLIIHPPILYFGYVGFSIPFAFAVAALLLKYFDKQWAQWLRPWTIAAWGFLTAGITLGSWWSYRVLGWGGWWAWDPVENAPFLPWLVGTALIHCLSAMAKRGICKGWAILLAISTFGLSLIGTFLVRSGLLPSVHAFANDPQRGLFLLIFLIVRRYSAQVKALSKHISNFP